MNECISMLQDSVRARKIEGWNQKAAPWWETMRLCEGHQCVWNEHIFVAVFTLHCLLCDLGLLPGLIGLPSRKTSILMRSRNVFLKVVDNCVRFKETKTSRSEIGPNGIFPLAIPIIKTLHFPIHSNIGNWTSLTPENENHNGFVNDPCYREASGTEETNLTKLVEKVGNPELRVSVD